MYSVRHEGGSIPTIELHDDARASLAVLAPSRGGMLTRLAIAGREILYLDRATFEDTSSNVRGGNPVLFPSPGKLAGDAWAIEGARGAMKQHGFARNLPWDVVETSDAGVASATLRLRSNDVTRSQYPWDFTAEYAYSLHDYALRIDMRFVNEGSARMPFGAGFHPYFAVPQAEKAHVRILTGGTRAFDNAAKRDIAFTGFDLTAKEVDIHLYDHGSSEARICFDDAPDIALRGSPELGHWVVWTLAGRDFVCVEPWTCPGNALNTGERLIWLAPGEERATWLEIGGD